MKIIFPWEVDDEAVGGTTRGGDPPDSSPSVGEVVDRDTAEPDGLDTTVETVEAARRLAEGAPGSLAEFVDGLETLAAATGRPPSELADALGRIQPPDESE